MDAPGDPIELPARCVPCDGDLAALTAGEAGDRLRWIPGWILEYPRLVRRLSFDDFATALEFVAQVGALAEDQGHHPDLHLTDYREVEVVLWTHAVGGLSDNDFVLAREIEALVS